MAGRKKGAGSRRGRGKGKRAGGGTGAEAFSAATEAEARAATGREETGAETGAEAGGEKGEHLESSDFLTPGLAALHDEASGEGDQASADPPGDDPAPPAAVENAQMKIVIATAVGIGGNMACQRLNVAPFDSGEVTALTDALIGVLDAFGGVVFLDPKTAAVINVGVVAAAIVIRRIGTKGGQGDGAAEAGRA